MKERGLSSKISIPDVFDSNQFEPAERFERWRERIAPAFSMERPIRPGDEYQAKHEVWDLGGMVFARADQNGGRFSRTEQMRRQSGDHWCVLYLKSGIDVASADQTAGMQESISTARAGDLGFYSLAQTCRGVMREMKALTLYIPREGFAKQAHDFDRLSNSIISSPRAIVLGDYLQSLERQIENCSTADIAALGLATRAMIAACLSPTADTVEDAETPELWLNRTKAGRYIRAHLGNPCLSPQHICHSVGVSRSKLYRMFESAGGVFRYIRQARLHAAHKLLTEEQTARRVGDVAVAVGFTDISDFSRAFSREFGYSPSQARANASEGGSGLQAVEFRDPGASLISWLNGRA
ncbi:helix-turn-helix domain-containing protein [Labrys neptuniae]